MQLLKIKHLLFIYKKPAVVFPFQVKVLHSKSHTIQKVYPVTELLSCMTLLDLKTGTIIWKQQFTVVAVVLTTPSPR